MQADAGAEGLFRQALEHCPQLVPHFLHCEPSHPAESTPPLVMQEQPCIPQTARLMWVQINLKAAQSYYQLVSLRLIVWVHHDYSVMQPISCP